ELGRAADVLLSADARLIDEMMIPHFADWNIRFARNEMVVAYSSQSRFADRIGLENWYEILLEEGVACGSSDPRTDPVGYRARMVWQLAERYYDVPGLASALDKRCAQEHVRPRSMELVVLLQSGNLDYAFLYRSVAQQYDLRFVPLPPQINLCCPEYAPYYRQATVEFQESGNTVVIPGEPIVYGVTVPKNAPDPDLAVLFVRFLLEPEARDLLEKMGQPAIVPPEVHGRENLPAPLRALFP
ncbi:MAG: extracellular solute-binding protein, partial [Anaerolineae bacterium]|nr:extracellular solute-binding protein [Anaerolineae bacterium]